MTNAMSAAAVAIFLFRVNQPAAGSTVEIARVVATSSVLVFASMPSASVARLGGVEGIGGNETPADEFAETERSRSDGDVGNAPDSIRCFSRLNLPSNSFAV